MEISIRNCAKLHKADITLNGITVIAGENNTGKSTVGKILFMIFNALYDLDRKVFKNKIESMNSNIDLFIREHDINLKEDDDDIFSLIIESDSILKLAYDKRNNISEEIENAISTIKCYNNLKINEFDLQELYNKLKSISSVSNEDIAKSIFGRYIYNEFSGQLTNINCPNEESDIKLSLNGKYINISLSNNTVKNLNIGCNIISKSIYIDSPFVIDNLSSYRIISSANDEHNIYSHLEQLDVMLRKKANKNLIDEVLVNDKISSILNKLDEIMPDSEIIKDDFDYVYRDNNTRGAIKVSNLSTGLKTFIIIKTLLQNGSLKEKGVLVLDEPEVHLHPKWQLLFAEIIVLLYKELNLHILLNTHSPYFLNAIEVYSAKYNVADKCKYYLASNSDDDTNHSEIKDVTTNTQCIYEILAEPLIRLEDLKQNMGE